MNQNHLWLGLSDRILESTWVWESSNVTLNTDSYTNWGPLEPRHVVDYEDCVVLHKTTGKWADVKCDRQQVPVCETQYHMIIKMND